MMLDVRFCESPLHFAYGVGFEVKSGDKEPQWLYAEITNEELDAMNARDLARAILVLGRTQVSATGYMRQRPAATE